MTTTNRNLIIYFLNNFIDDSEVAGMIFRILRKSFQVLTRDSLIKMIDQNDLTNSPQKIFDVLVVIKLFILFKF